MTVRLLVIPGSPALVPELAPRDQAARSLLDRIRLQRGTFRVVGSRDSRWKTSRSGSFGAWGAPNVTVGEGSYLPELIARFALGSERIDPTAEDCVVVLDGSAALHERAPLGLLPPAAAVESWCRNLLSDGPQHGVARPTARWLEEGGIVEPDLWRWLATLRPTRTKLLAADTSTGVARYLADWIVP